MPETLTPPELNRAERAQFRPDTVRMNPEKATTIPVESELGQLALGEKLADNEHVDVNWTAEDIKSYLTSIETTFTGEDSSEQPDIKFRVSLNEVPDKPASELVDLFKDQVHENLIKAREQYIDGKVQEAWWTHLDNDEHETDPFAGKMTEQVVFNTPHGDIVLHNFGDTLTESQIKQAEQLFTTISQITDARGLDRLKNIIVSSTFKEEIGGFASNPGKFIAVNAERLGLSLEEFDDEGIKHGTARAGDSTAVGHDIELLTYTLAHEIGHQIDWVDRSHSYFSYNVGQPTDPEFTSEQLIDNKANKTTKTDEIYTDEQINDSKPPTKYAETHENEDFAESFVRLVLAPETLDPLRRDALISELRTRLGSEPLATPIQFIKRSDGSVRAESSSPAVTSVRRTGSDIILPSIELPKKLKYQVEFDDQAEAEAMLKALR